MFSFGQGVSGQLGIKTTQNKYVPQCVLGNWRSPSGRNLTNNEINDQDAEEIFFVKNVSALFFILF